MRWWEVLGIGRGASASEVIKAFRDAVRKYHPDRNSTDPDAKVKFQAAVDAYKSWQANKAAGQFSLSSQALITMFLVVASVIGPMIARWTYHRLAGGAVGSRASAT